MASWKATQLLGRPKKRLGASNQVKAQMLTCRPEKSISDRPTVRGKSPKRGGGGDKTELEKKLNRNEPQKVGTLEVRRFGRKEKSMAGKTRGGEVKGMGVNKGKEKPCGRRGKLVISYRGGSRKGLGCQKEIAEDNRGGENEVSSSTTIDNVKKKLPNKPGTAERGIQ